MVIRTSNFQSSSRLAGAVFPVAWALQKLANMLCKTSCSSSRRKMRLSRCRLTRFLSLGENRSQMILAASSRIRESGDLSSCTYLVSDPTELMGPPSACDLSLHGEPNVDDSSHQPTMPIKSNRNPITLCLLRRREEARISDFVGHIL